MCLAGRETLLYLSVHVCMTVMLQDQPGMHTCGYSGRRFVHKKYYDEKTMGPCVTYEQYCEEIGREED